MRCGMSEPILDCANAAKVRHAVADCDAEALGAMRFDSITIGAGVELCCAHQAWRAVADSCGVNAFHRLTGVLPALAELWAHFERALIDPNSRFETCDKNIAVCGVSQKRAFEERSWNEFQQHLVTRLKSNGFDAGFSYALSAAFGEIAENVPDHSAPENVEMAAALVCYYVLPGEIHFAVGDVGRGVLASLHENPKWAGLPDSRDAIRATLEQAATRKSAHPEGTGLKLALKSFVDRNGLLAMSSGDATANVAREADGRSTTYGLAPWLAGTCVAATCFARGAPVERPLR